MDLEKNFRIAAAALLRLEEWHKLFMRSVVELKEPAVDGAELKVVKGELQAICLAVPLIATHRPIARNGELEVVEYAFAMSNDQRPIIVWSMFLANDHLYEDVVCKKFICQASNKYLTSRVVPHLAAALLQSEIFSPRSLS